MLFLAILGCTTCQPLTWFAEDASLGEHAMYRANYLAWWADQRCLAQIRVSEHAPLDGESWREPEGWTVAIAPEDLGTDALERQVCRTIAYENRPLLRAPDELFAATEGQTRVDRFAEACAEGPTQRVYIEQSVSACGLDPLTEEQQFLEEHVFTAAPLVTAPSVTPVAGTPVSFPYTRLWRTEFTVTPWEHLSLVDGLLWSRTLDGGQQSMLLGDPLDPMAFSGDRERVVFLTYGADLWQDRDLVVLDRATGERSRHTLDWPDTVMTWWESPMTIVGDHVLVGQIRDWEAQGAIAIVPIDGGPVEPVILPAPDAPAPYTAVLDMWPDPTDAEAVLLHLLHQDYWSSGDVGGGTFYGDQIVRLDLRDRSFSTLLQSSGWAERRARIDPIGPTDDGNMLFGIQVASERWLLGALDLLDGTVLVSDTTCMSYPWGMFTLEDALVLRAWPSDDVVTWTPLRL